MTTILIKDLTESVDLDREAMVAITGGARIRGRQPFSAQPLQRGSRIVDYPPGLKGAAAKAAGPAAGKKPAK